MTTVHVLGLRAKFHCGTFTRFGLTTSSVHHLGSKLCLTNYSGKSDRVHHKFCNLTDIRVFGRSTLILPYSLTSHVKLTEISVATFKTNSLIFLLLGLTVISKYFFNLFIYNNVICNNRYKKAAIRKELNPHVR